MSVHVLYVTYWFITYCICSYVLFRKVHNSYDASGDIPGPSGGSRGDSSAWWVFLIVVAAIVLVIAVCYVVAVARGH